MREDSRKQRQAQIEAAAYQVLREKGYVSASMLTIAKAAKASNETLYNWYGDKIGLFQSLVTRNAAEVKALLEQDLQTPRPAQETLACLGPKLLNLVLSDKSIALNRAAAADPTGDLGATIASAGRGTVVPLLQSVLKRGAEEGAFRFDDLEEATDLYIRLLIGDLQIRRVIGQGPGLDEAQVAARAARALAYFTQLFGAK